MKDLLNASGADAVIDRLKKGLEGRAEAYEIFFSAQKGFGVEAKDGEVDSLKVRSSAGVGIRTISKGRLGFAFSSVLEGDVLDEMASKSLAGSLEASLDEFLRFTKPGPVRSEEGLGIFDGSYLSVPEEEKGAAVSRGVAGNRPRGGQRPHAHRIAGQPRAVRPLGGRSRCRRGALRPGRRPGQAYRESRRRRRRTAQPGDDLHRARHRAQRKARAA